MKMIVPQKIMIWPIIEEIYKGSIDLFDIKLIVSPEELATWTVSPEELATWTFVVGSQYYVKNIFC